MNKKTKILNMIKENKISAEEGLELIKALGKEDEKQEEKKDLEVIKFNKTDVKDDKLKNLKGKFVVEVESAAGDNVKINLPLKLARLAVSMIPSEAMSNIREEGIDLSEIINNISDIIDDVDDDIINVESAGGDMVRIYIKK